MAIVCWFIGQDQLTKSEIKWNLTRERKEKISLHDFCLVDVAAGNT